MRDIILAFDRFGDQALLLARAGENRATRIQIDLKSILSQYPDAIASITVKPPGRAEYPATVKQEDGILTWEITSADLCGKAGNGKAQITIRGADGTIIKTAIACTRIGESLVNETDPAPDPVETWIDKATDTLADVERAGNAAQAVADEVQRRLDDGDFVGPQGPKGDTGPQGETGAKGDAFTFADFTPEQLESLRGPKGDTGATGAQGEKGDKGDKGDTGAKGEPGKDAVIDATLTQEGEAADAATTGKRLAEIEKAVAGKADKARQNILIGSETGNPVSASDAFSAPLCGLTIYGRSTQDGTPTPDAPVPIVSAGDGGTILVTVGDGADGQQTITLQTPNGLHGIPVTSGGNYTDENGQQWICDEVDLERGVRVQNTRLVDVSTLRISGSTKIQTMKRLSYVLAEIAQPTKIKSMCNILPYLASFDRDVIHFYVNKGNIFAFIPVDAEPPLEGECFVLYALDTPIEMPLTDAEIAAYKALTTYAPNTVVQAADGAGLKLDYQRDVNIVIKNLEDAIASMTAT